MGQGADDHEGEHMHELEDDFQPWTSQGAERLRAAGEQLAAAVRAHAEAVSGIGSDAGFGDVMAASEALVPLIVAYADAQFEYTGSAFPFGELQQPTEDDADDEEELSSMGITVLQRHDYAVRDEQAVLRAGRAAYLRVWPDDDEAAAARDVNHLGRALYQIAHADGWRSLEDTAGLEATGAVISVHEQEDLLTDDPDEWPEDPFDIEGEQLYREDDVYH